MLRWRARRRSRFPSSTAAGAQAPPSVDDLLARVGERVAEFYTRAKNVVCTETSRVQPIDLDNAPLGFSRTVESELRIEIENPDIPSAAAILRKIRRVNGRVPRESDKKDRAGCTDPNPLSSEPTRVSAAGSPFRVPLSDRRRRERSEIAPLSLIDFESIDRRSNPELIRDPEGRDDCFDWSGRIASRGRVWVDASNYDVLRVERRLRGPVDVKVPMLIQRRHRLDPFVVIVRDEIDDSISGPSPSAILTRCCFFRNRSTRSRWSGAAFSRPGEARRSPTTGGSSREGGSISATSAAP